MSSGFELDDRAFLAGLRQAFDDFEVHDGPESLKPDGQHIVDAAKRYVHVESGETRDSIEMWEVRDGKEVSIMVGCNPAKIDNAKVNAEEYGTFDQAPRPFMRPAQLEVER